MLKIGKSPEERDDVKADFIASERRLISIASHKEARAVAAMIANDRCFVPMRVDPHRKVGLMR
jgi:hypothetical protein